MSRNGYAVLITSIAASHVARATAYYRCNLVTCVLLLHSGDWLPPWLCVTAHSAEVSARASLSCGLMVQTSCALSLEESSGVEVKSHDQEMLEG